jgi:transcriptional regulator with XRE-family HTH domain
MAIQSGIFHTFARCRPTGRTPERRGRVAKLAEQFGKQVRARRKARSLTQARLSEAAGLSEEWLRRIERGAGAPSFEALEALAGALSCSVADLFSGMTSRDEAGVRLAALLSAAPDNDLPWLEELIRVALRRPRG